MKYVTTRLLQCLRRAPDDKFLDCGYVPLILTAFLIAVPSLSTSVQAQEAPSTLSAIPLSDMQAFRPAAENWSIAGGVYANRSEHHSLEARPGTGVLIGLPTDGARDNLFTRWEHGDLRLELDVVMPKGSNSGIYLQGRYEVQLLDSWGVREPRFSDIGGIYERWDEERPEGWMGFGGVAPRVNAARAPGLWQHLEIDFRAPRFDDQGRKVENARFLRVMLNGVVVQENVEVTGPTRASAFDDEAAEGPLMLQGDHGPVAFRNIYFKRFGADEVQVSEVAYRFYEGAFERLPALDTLSPTRQGVSTGIRHDVVTNPDTFAVAFDGRISVPTTGRYRFALDLDWVYDDSPPDEPTVGGGLLRIGGHDVVQHDGEGRTAAGDIHLEAGDHTFSLAYFKNRRWSQPLALLRVSGPDTRETVLNLPASISPKDPVSSTLVDADGGVVLHRSMIDHDGERHTHAMSVGDPSRTHYSVDFETGALLRAWHGPFLDATPMWHSRGSSQVSLPRGSAITFTAAPSVAVLSDPSAPWPSEAMIDFEGYDIGDDGRPVIRYRLDGERITDSIRPDDSGFALKRTINAAGGGNMWHRVATADHIERLPDGSFAVGDKSYYVVIDDRYDPVLRVSENRQELLVPLRETAAEYQLIW